MIEPIAFSFDSIYIGGGTPSLFEPKEIEVIVETAGDSFTIQPKSEITIEANPGTIDENRLIGYRSAGVNRISIGVQSFQDTHLQILSRVHTSKEADRAIKAAQTAGFGNIGLDLIFGLPGQTPSSWRMDLQRALEYAPDHLSCYQLTYEPGTRLDNYRKARRLSPLSEPRIARLLEIAIAYLTEHGYIQYEISNFAKSSEKISRHNAKYWSSAPYIGLGPSAHSFVPPRRYWNHTSLDRYVEDVVSGIRPIAGNEVLSREERITEAVYLGLRTTEGIDIEEFNERFQVNFFDMFQKTIQVLLEEEMINMAGTRCVLTHKGMLYLDSIASMFITSDL